jgi:hypothetical protein
MPMIIPQIRTVHGSNRQEFAWASLRKFQNAELIAEELMKLHQLASRWRENARKQAQQLRHCIIQAREYFNAARAVSLATKPNLLYYGMMSLAFSEILFKQSGLSSLDKARQQNKHHGLSMTVGDLTKNTNLATAASNLRATPMVHLSTLLQKSCVLHQRSILQRCDLLIEPREVPLPLGPVRKLRDRCQYRRLRSRRRLWRSRRLHASRVRLRRIHSV